MFKIWQRRPGLRTHRPRRYYHTRVGAHVRCILATSRSRFPIDEGRTLFEIPKDALDLLKGTAEVFGDLSR